MERVYPDHQWDKELQEFQLWAIVILTIALEILLLIWPRTTSGIDAVIIIAILLGVYYNNKSGKEIAQEDQIRRARAIDPERPF